MKALFDEDFAELYMEGCTFLLTKLFMQTQVGVWTNKPLRTKAQQTKTEEKCEKCQMIQNYQPREQGNND